MPKVSDVPRKVLRGGLRVTECSGTNALTEKYAKDILGWVEESPNDPFGEDYLLIDTDDNRIQCENNTKNRPLNNRWCLSLAQDILAGNWMLNGESIIIGDTGQVLSGQHRLVALILACQQWRADPRWRKLNKRPPVLETVLVRGVSEDQECVRTLDNVNPRSLSDVLYTSDYLQDYSTSGRKQAARIADYAIKLLWQRTGRKDAFRPHRTHSEALDFLSRHLTLLECVKHIYEENQAKGITKYLSPGSAAGLMYLQAASNTDPNRYYDGNPPNENLLDLSAMPEATEFWTGLVSSLKTFNALRKSLNRLKESNLDGISYVESLAMVILGWRDFVNTGSTREVQLEYEVLDDVRKLVVHPTIGGIDKWGEEYDEDDE